MMLEIDPDSAVPPYEQLRQQVSALVLLGALEVGARLPSIRQLANDLGLASGTVARAYRELEADGVVATRGRHGTTVSAGPKSGDPGADLLDAAGRYAHQTRQAGLSLEDAVVALRVAFAAGSSRKAT
jgi:DNA-binding transcriptional regulator YhcF (GntR family)